MTKLTEPAGHAPVDRSAALRLVVLALPGAVLLVAWAAGWAGQRFALDPTGQIAAGLLLASLSVTPVARLLAGSAMAARLSAARLSGARRAMGLASFAYALLHMALFVIAIGDLGDIVAGLAWASMWTGWLAFLCLSVPAAISFGPARRMSRRAWTAGQRMAYPAAALMLAHWLLLAPAPGWALFWGAVFLALQMVRLIR